VSSPTYVRPVDTATRGSNSNGATILERPPVNRNDNETDGNEILSAFLKHGKFLYGKGLDLFKTDLKLSRPAK
jgi:hypothetical protein